MPRCLPLTIALLLPSVVCGADDVPRSHDPRVAITLFAENPQIVTPTGIDVDSAGRVWAIESNTHFPPENYAGHPTDRVLVFRDENGDGKAEVPVVFLDGLTHTMSVAVLPVWLNLPKDATDKPPLIVYLATRKQMFRCVDTNGDLVCDEKTSIIRLETEGNYPHNGLAGFAFSPVGEMYFGFGENLGAAYKIVGSDGTTLSGGGEGGNIYRAQPDGSKLALVATGFWNPHANAFDAWGRLFSVDNDPDSRPPCRLLHIIEGGDYGYRFRNGRKGLHPFTSWNGEIPGTLPMVAGTGEAPSGILAYESDGLPDEYRGRLFVTSWGDHRIDTFVLKPSGASVQSNTEPLITGGENFRPVGIACAPDGSLYCTDWVLRDYKLHGKGRIWRIAAKENRNQPVVDVGNLVARSGQDLASESILNHPRVDVRRTAARLLARDEGGQQELGKRLQGRLIRSSGHQWLESLWATISSVAPVKLKRELAEVGLIHAEGQSDVLILSEVFRIAGRSLGPHIVNSRWDVLRQSGFRGLKDWRNDMPLALALLQSEQVSDVKDIEAAAILGDSFLFSAVVDWLATRKADLTEAWNDSDASKSRFRLAATLAARHRAPRDAAVLELAIDDRDRLVRRAAVQWVAEEGLTQFRPKVEGALNEASITADLFLASLAALEMLDGRKPEEFDKTPPEKYVLPIVADLNRPAAVRAIALRLVPPADPGLSTGLLTELVKSPDANLRREAVRTLSNSTIPQAPELLQGIAQTEEDPLRLEALSGLASAAQADPSGGPTRAMLLSLLTSDSPAVLREALRGLRSIDDPAVHRIVAKVGERAAMEQDSELGAQVLLALGLNADPRMKELLEDRPTSPDEWRQRLEYESPQPTLGDADAGRRLFYHLKGPGCASCHTVDGRGGKLGPDLSTIGRSLSRDKLIDSILDPAREIAPQFVTWAMETKDGKTHSGMIVFENEGNLTLGTTDGKTLDLKTIDVLDRRPQEKSVMPEKLAERMTVQEFRDLLAYLTSLR